MAQETCPFCKSLVNEGAEVCHSCGAQKGYGGAGRSKHDAGWLGLMLAGLAYWAFSADDPLLSAFGALISVGATVLFARWAANLSTPPLWYRPRHHSHH